MNNFFAYPWQCKKPSSIEATNINSLYTKFLANAH